MGGHISRTIDKPCEEETILSHIRIGANALSGCLRALGTEYFYERNSPTLLA